MASKKHRKKIKKRYSKKPLDRLIFLKQWMRLKNPNTESSNVPGNFSLDLHDNTLKLKSDNYDAGFIMKMNWKHICLILGIENNLVLDFEYI